jgi:hypothetical protein
MAERMVSLNLGQRSPSLSYADVARTPPNSQPSNAQTLYSMNTTPSTLPSTIYCTIDTSGLAKGARLMRDDLYPVRVDSVTTLQYWTK